jgi:hypothetical protein
VGDYRIEWCGFGAFCFIGGFMNIFVEVQPLVYFEHVIEYEMVEWFERKCAGIKASRK